MIEPYCYIRLWNMMLLIKRQDFHHSYRTSEVTALVMVNYDLLFLPLMPQTMNRKRLLFNSNSHLLFCHWGQLLLMISVCESAFRGQVLSDTSEMTECAAARGSSPVGLACQWVQRRDKDLWQMHVFFHYFSHHCLLVLVLQRGFPSSMPWYNTWGLRGQIDLSQWLNVKKVALLGFADRLSSRVGAWNERPNNVHRFSDPGETQQINPLGVKGMCR